MRAADQTELICRRRSPDIILPESENSAPLISDSIATEEPRVTGDIVLLEREFDLVKIEENCFEYFADSAEK